MVFPDSGQGYREISDVIHPVADISVHDRIDPVQSRGERHVVIACVQEGADRTLYHQHDQSRLQSMIGHVAYGEHYGTILLGEDFIKITSNFRSWIHPGC